MPTYRYIMFSNPTEGRDADFNAWYDDVHIPDIMNTGAFTRGERFEVVSSPHTPPSEQRYAAIYDIEGDDPDAALDKLVASFTRGEMRMSDAMDMATGRPILLKTLGATDGAG